MIHFILKAKRILAMHRHRPICLMMQYILLEAIYYQKEYKWQCCCRDISHLNGATGTTCAVFAACFDNNFFSHLLRHGKYRMIFGYL